MIPNISFWKSQNYRASKEIRGWRREGRMNRGSELDFQDSELFILYDPVTVTICHHVFVKIHTTLQQEE